jgi:hypothetical protein
MLRIQNGKLIGNSTFSCGFEKVWLPRKTQKRGFMAKFGALDQQIRHRAFSTPTALHNVAQGKRIGLAE